MTGQEDCSIGDRPDLLVDVSEGNGPFSYRIAMVYGDNGLACLWGGFQVKLSLLYRFVPWTEENRCSWKEQALKPTQRYNSRVPTCDRCATHISFARVSSSQFSRALTA